MKRTRFFRIFSLVGCFLMAASAVFAQPGAGRGGNFADFSYTVSPTRAIELDMVKQLGATAEFTEFFNALTARIDEEYVKAGNQPNFPTPMADKILDKVRVAKGREEISSKDVIELFFSEVELIQLEGFLKRAYDAGVFEQPNNPEGGKYFRLTVVTKFNPAELSDALDFIKPYVPVDMINDDENDFLFSISDPNNADAAVFFGGRQIEDLGNYVTALSLSRELVEQKLNSMQNERGRRFMLGENTAPKSLRVGSGFFDIVRAEIQKKVEAGSVGEKDALRLAEQVSSFSVVTRDFEGKTGTQFRLVLNSEDAAGDLRDMANGGKALLRFMIGSEGIDADAKKLINLLLKTEINQDGPTLSATVNWSDEEFAALAKEALKKATEEIKKR